MPEENVVQVTSRTRRLDGVGGVVQRVCLAAIPILGLAYVLGIHSFVGLVVYQEQWVGLLLALYFVTVFLSFPAVKNRRQHSGKPPWYDLLLAVVGTAPGGFLAWNYPDLVFALGVPSPERTFLGLLVLVLLAESLRRTIGWSLVIVLAVVVLYGFTSSSFVGLLHGTPVSPERLMNYIYVDPSAILGMLGLAATIGLAFVLFGQVLLHFGAGESMTNLAVMAFGRFRGGGSKAAIAGSSLTGTITGAPMSNVLLTGTLTIPLMKRTGYKASTAAAIEALASSGGQIMPPVMGIAAFVMADNLGIPYSEVALAALIPAVLLYFTLFLSSDLEARKRGISRIPLDSMPERRSTILGSWLLLPTVGTLIVLMFVVHMQPGRAAALSALIAIPVMMLAPANRGGSFKKLGRMLTDTGLVVGDLAGVLAVSGVVVGVVSVSGLGFNFADAAAVMAGDSILLLLIATAVAAIVLGMGMPSVAAYALVAVLLVPGLVAAGVEPLAAHMFVFYFAVVSNVTPPIAVAVFAAATLAGSKPMKTGFEAMRLGWAFYVIPAMFIISPSLLLQGDASNTAIVTITALGAIVALSVAASGFAFRPISILTRVLLAVSGIALLIPPDVQGGLVANVGAAILGFALLLLEFRAAKGARLQSPTVIEKERK